MFDHRKISRFITVFSILYFFGSCEILSEKKTEQNRRYLDKEKALFEKNIYLASKSKDWEVARSFWQNSLSIAQQRGWVRESLTAYRGMGLHYQRKGAFLEAAYYFQKGLLLSEQVKDIRYQIETYVSLGTAYSVAGDFAKSIQSLDSAAVKAQNFDQKLHLTSINEIGNTYYSAGNFGKALEEYQRCIKLNNPIDSIQQCWFLINVAGAYRELKNPEKSMATYKELFRYGRYLTKEDSIVALSRLGQLYIQVGKVGVALRLGNLAKDLSAGNESYYSKSILYKTLAEANRSNHQWVKAYTYQGLFHQYRDSLLSQEQRQRLEAVKVGYENEKRRTELEHLGEEMKTQSQLNLLLWTGMTLFAIFSAVIMFFYFQLRKKRMQIEKQRNEISVLNSYLEKRVQQGTSDLQQANRELIRKNNDIGEALLKGQTIERQRVASELHDNLGGTLTAIQWYLDAMLFNDDDKAGLSENYGELQTMISRAYTEVRLLSHHMMPEVLQKDGLEVALEQLAIPINKSKRLNLVLEMAPVGVLLNSQQQFELYNIALELCTNILKHSHASEALLKLESTVHEVILTISDNGIGIGTEMQAKSMGHRNILARLKSIGGSLNIQSAPNKGTVISVTIPSTVALRESEAT